MNTGMATASTIRVSSRPDGLAGLAVQAGRLLETWGQLRASRLHDRERILRRLERRRCALEALEERDALLRSSSFQPLR